MSKLFSYWIFYFIIMLIIIAGFVIWAIRSRQFKDQDRARYLPLDDQTPDNDEEKNK